MGQKEKDIQRYTAAPIIDKCILKYCYQAGTDDTTSGGASDYFENQNLRFVSWIDPRTVIYYQAKRLLGLRLWKEAWVYSRNLVMF